MTKMTREQAIKSYVEQLSGSELANLLQYINVYDGNFADCAYYDMDLFDEFMDGYTPMEIAKMIWFGEFNPNADYFRFNAYGNLESMTWHDVEVEAGDLVYDIIGHLVNSYSGDTPWAELDYLVDSDDDAIFNEDFEEIDDDDDADDDDE